MDEYDRRQIKECQGFVIRRLDLALRCYAGCRERPRGLRSREVSTLCVKTKTHEGPVRVKACKSVRGPSRLLETLQASAYFLGV